MNMAKQLIDKIEFTEEQRQILYGALLGDGSLILHEHGKMQIFPTHLNLNNM